MASLFGNLKSYLDIVTKRYVSFPATDPADVEACIQVLEEVRKKELNRVAGASVLDSHSFSGKSLDYTLMACKDTKTGKIIGCMRITPAVDALSVPASRAEYSMDSIPEVFLKTLWIFTRLAVLKPFRKTPAALVLMTSSMQYVLEANGQGAISACEPNLYPMYLGLGLRPYGLLHNSPSGGYRIPMIFLPDLKHMKSVKSPALSLVKNFEFERFTAINQWFRQWFQEHHVAHLGIKPLKDAHVNPDVHRVVTDGLSLRGKQAFLKNALVVQCEENDVLVAMEDGGKGLGIVLQGEIKVVFKDKELARLSTGELFGEIAFVLDTRRTASLVSVAPDTQILLFSNSAYQRLEDPSDKMTLWHNIARILAQRVLTSDKRIF